MKADEFRALCGCEWDEANGDVFALTLTPGSLAEFTGDVLADPAGDLREWPLRIPVDAPPAAGASLTSVMNPRTRTKVTVSEGAGTDMYQVRRPVSCRPGR